MTQYKPADSKREEFRKYLEKAGVMDALTKVLVGLYEEPEKPNNALDFLKSHLGGTSAEEVMIEDLKAEVGSLTCKVEALQAENAELKARLLEFEPKAEADAEEAPAE